VFSQFCAPGALFPLRSVLAVAILKPSTTKVELLTPEREDAGMLRFLVFFRYAMSFHGPRIDDHVAAEMKAFEDRLTKVVPVLAGPPKTPAM
jgi:hypothetical protein